MQQNKYYIHMQFTVYIKLNYIQYRCLVNSVSVVCRLWAGQPKHHGSTSPTDNLRLGTFHIPASIMSLSTNDNRTSSYSSTSSMFCNGVLTNSHNQWVIQGQYSVAKFSNKHFTRTHHRTPTCPSFVSLPHGRDKTNQMSSIRGS